MRPLVPPDSIPGGSNPQSSVPRRVVKIGGSLLDAADLRSRFASWLAKQTIAENWVIVGGGDVVEAMRQLDQRFSLDPVPMHWRCVRLLRATFEITRELFPHWSAIECSSDFQAACNASPHATTRLIAVDSFYSESTGASAGLPVGWETTTDSIAAYLAITIAAEELTLLKSCPVIPGRSPPELAAAGIVDAAFPKIASTMSATLRLEQLR